MPSGRFFACSGFTSGTTNGTCGFMRNAPELSTATAPRSAAIGAHTSETSSGTSNMAMSMPSNASADSATTVSSSPWTAIFLPADLGDAMSRISPQMFGRLLMMSIITVPTAPVAPTSARFGLRVIGSPMPGVSKISDARAGLIGRCRRKPWLRCRCLVRMRCARHERHRLAERCR